MAALLGQFDFIYALPSAWILTPFSFLGALGEPLSRARGIDIR
jgi:peroxisomal 3,2-trans-enoyl-CoA isomerase